MADDDKEPVRKLFKDNAQLEHHMKNAPRKDHAPPGATGISVPAPPGPGMSTDTAPKRMFKGFGHQEPSQEQDHSPEAPTKKLFKGFQPGDLTKDFNHEI